MNARAVRREREPAPEPARGYRVPLQPARLASSLVAVVLGGALAIGEPGPTRWPIWVAVAIATLLLHAGGRFLMISADARRARSGPRGGTGDALPPPARLVAIGALCVALGSLVGFLAVIERGWPLFWLGVVGLLGGLAYSQGPALRENALGEVSSFFLFGPLPVVAAYLAVTGVWSPLAFLVSVPLGLLSAGAVLASGVHDRDEHARGGVVTLAGRLGRPTAVRLYGMLVAAAHLWVLWLVVRGLLAPISLLVLLTLPEAARAFLALRAPAPEGAARENPAVRHAARNYVFFAAALALTVALSHWIWQRAI